MSRRRSVFGTQRYRSANEFQNTLEQLLNADDLHHLQGAEKVFLFSDSVPFGLAFYKIQFYAQERNTFRRHRMDAFAQLGASFSPDIDVTTGELPNLIKQLHSLLQNDPNPQKNEDVKAAIQRLIIDPTNPDREAIIITQPNWCSSDNGQYRNLRDYIKQQEPIPNPEELALELLYSLSLAEANALTFDDLKDDNVLVAQPKDPQSRDAWTIKLIDLGPMDYRLSEYFIEESAHADPKRWENLRLAYLIHQIAATPGQQDELREHLIRIERMVGTQKCSIKTKDYDFLTLKNWAEHRSTSPNPTLEHIIGSLCENGLSSKEERVHSYLEIIANWIEHFEQGNSSLSKESLIATRKILALQYAEHLSHRQQATEKGTPQSAETAQTPLKRLLPDYKYTTPAPAGDASPNPINLSLKRSHISRQEADNTLGNLKHIFFGTRNFLSTRKIQHTSLEVEAGALLANVAVEMNTLITQMEQKSAQAVGSPFAVKAYQGELNRIKQHNQGLTAYKRQHQGAVVAAAACLLIGAGGLGAGVYLFLQSVTIPAITITIMVLSALLMLLSAAPIVIAYKRHPSRFFEDAKAHEASKHIKSIDQQHP